MLDILEGTFAFGEHRAPDVRGFGYWHTELFDEKPNDAFECDAVRGKMNAIERFFRWKAWFRQATADMQVRIRVLIWSVSNIIVAKDPTITKQVVLVLKIGFLHLQARPARCMLAIEHERQP